MLELIKQGCVCDTKVLRKHIVSLSIKYTDLTERCALQSPQFEALKRLQDGARNELRLSSSFHHVLQEAGFFPALGPTEFITADAIVAGESRAVIQVCKMLLDNPAAFDRTCERAHGNYRLCFVWGTHVPHALWLACMQDFARLC